MNINIKLFPEDGSAKFEQNPLAAGVGIKIKCE